MLIAHRTNNQLGNRSQYPYIQCPLPPFRSNSFAARERINSIYSFALSISSLSLYLIHFDIETFNGWTWTYYVCEIVEICVFITPLWIKCILYSVYSQIFIRFWKVFALVLFWWPVREDGSMVWGCMMAQSIFGMRINNTWRVHKKTNKTRTTMVEKANERVILWNQQTYSNSNI